MADISNLLGKVSSPILDKIVAAQKRIDSSAQAAPAESKTKRAPDTRPPAARNKPKPKHAKAKKEKDHGR